MSKNAKEGDQIMLKWKNPNQTRQFIFPFATILRIDRKGSETIFIFDDSKKEQKISKTSFLSLTKKLDIKKTLGNRSKEISIIDALKFKEIWK